jgi:hypothetical protein
MLSCDIGENVEYAVSTLLTRLDGPNSRATSGGRHFDTGAYHSFAAAAVTGVDRQPQIDHTPKSFTLLHD